MRDLLEEARPADELGLKVFAVGEHHRPGYLVSSPTTVLAAIAAVTKQIISFYETFEPERYLAHIGIGAVSHRDVMRAIELFGSQVAPTVQSETRLTAGRVP